MNFYDTSPEQDEFLPTGNERTGARYDALQAIQAADPDGGYREPTDADYAAHEAWAVAAFGRATWDAYRRGGWDAPDW